MECDFISVYCYTIIMKIDDSIIDYLEELSKLSLTKSEKDGRKKDLEEIITFVEKLNELDTTKTKETNNPFGSANFLRDDVVVTNENKKKYLKNAPKKNDEYFKVVKVIDD